jgi:hypothetical protein
MCHRCYSQNKNKMFFHCQLPVVVALYKFFFSFYSNTLQKKFEATLCEKTRRKEEEESYEKCNFIMINGKRCYAAENGYMYAVVDAYFFCFH